MDPREVANHRVVIGYPKAHLVLTLVLFNLPLKVMDPSAFLSTDRTEISGMLDKICACPNRALLSVGFIPWVMVDAVEHILTHAKICMFCSRDKILHLCCRLH